MQTIIFDFTKKGSMRFISHLDLMRLFMRALRRARLPLKVSQGFNPHPKLSIQRALKLGTESDREEATVVLNVRMPLQEFISALNAQLPEGITAGSAHEPILQKERPNYVKRNNH